MANRTYNNLLNIVKKYVITEAPNIDDEYYEDELKL